MSRAVGDGGGRIVVQKAISSGPSSFVHFFDANASFVDKTLAIEAFLRSPGSHHLILRPRRCGKSYTLSMIRAFLQRPLRLESHHSRDITTSQFQSTAIAGPDYHDLVSAHFQQYPVLYIDLKVRGITFEKMLNRFDLMIIEILEQLSDPFEGIQDQTFIQSCQRLCNPEVLRHCRGTVLHTIARLLRNFFGKQAVVLIDEYDSPIHSAIEHNYVTPANNFFAAAFGSVLKNDDEVYASMMVGICKLAKSGWLSSLNHLDIFPIHAADDRYAKFFLFTEREVKILCDVHGKLSIEALRLRYNGYTARCADGIVKLYNPLSVVRALEKDQILNFWVETGRYSPLSQLIWRAGPEFRDNLDLLLTRKSVRLVMDDTINFLTYDTISAPGLWGLLYYTGYLTIQDLGKQPKHATSEYIFRIPNKEVTSEWHEWVMGYFKAKRVTSLSGVYDTLIGADAECFQRQFTTFLQEYLPLFCTPHHKEKVYQALCYMLILALGKEYDIRMDQGRLDTMAIPFGPESTLALIFEIKAVSRHETINSKQSLKTADRIMGDLEQAKTEALTQIEERYYRARVPIHAKKVYEYAFVFCGKFCVTAIRSFERNVMGDWQQVTVVTAGVSECMGDICEEVVGDEDEDA